MRISDWSSDVCSSDLEDKCGEQVVAKSILFRLRPCVRKHGRHCFQRLFVSDVLTTIELPDRRSDRVSVSPGIYQAAHNKLFDRRIEVGLRNGKLFNDDFFK